MKTRRNLANAMTLTPEKAAFIAGRAAKISADSAAPIAPDEEPATAKQTPADNFGGSSRGKTSSKLRKGGGASVAAHNSFVGELLVPLTTRIQPATANALRRAFLEQKLSHAKPDTQRDIVEEALTAWLSRNGFLA